MTAIKWLLIALSASFGLFILYIDTTSRVTNEYWVEFGIPAGCALNILYLLETGRRSKGDGRIRRLVDLWFAVKEAELRRRAELGRGVAGAEPKSG
jgi:hypothetical protein